MNVKLHFHDDVEKRLMDHLWASAPQEEGAFFLIGHARGASGDYHLIVRDVVLPEEGDWNSQGEDWLSPTSDYIFRATLAADRAGLGLAFVHTHPDPAHPATLSWVDVDGTNMLFQNLSAILPGAPLASIVFTPESAAGVALIDGKQHRVSHVLHVGARIRSELCADTRTTNRRISPMEARQILAYGEEGQKHLAELHIAIVGLGGTGGALAEQLARMGVGRFTLIDPDRMELSNVSRVYGSTPLDASARRTKVAVAEANILRIAPNARVTAHAADGATSDGWAALVDADVIFGCTDTHASRAMLTKLASACCVPVIDLGCRIDATDGALRAVLGRIRYLRPGLPCLWCTGSIDGRVILEEGMSPAERAARAAEGYGSGMGPQPSIVNLTTIVASLAVQELLTLVAHAGEPHDGAEVFIDLLGTTIMRATNPTDVTCRCHRLVGVGDNAKPVTEPSVAKPEARSDARA